MKCSPPFPIKKSPFVSLEEILSDQKHGFFPTFLRTLLYPPSLLYGGIVRSKNFLYDRGMVKQRQVPACVISIGNFVAGGTGKTPFIVLLAKKLQVHCKLAILSRGYLSQAEKSAPQLVTPEKKAEEVGDEALLLSRLLPDVMVIAGRDRMKGAKMACEMGAEIILLDDGMQHRALFRDFEIVLLSPYKSERYLPSGMLRDDPRRIDQADLIVTRAAKNDNEVEIKTFFKEFQFVSGEKKQSFGRCKVALFCGLAGPGRFVKSMQDEGLEIVLAHFLRDHRVISFQSLKQFSREAKRRRAELLICTEKDIVKLHDPSSSALDLPLAYAKVECEVTKNEWVLDRFIEKVVSRVL